MPLARRTTAILCALLAAFALAGCGVDAGDAATTTTTTTPAEDLSPTQQAAVDTVAKLYEELGMKPDDAQCLARAIAGSTGTLDPTDTGQMMDLINQCDIPMSELSKLGQEQGLTSLEDGVKFGLRTSLKALGLTEEQAACVADAYVDEYGTDMSNGQDPEKLRPLFEGCDVDPAKVGN